MSKFTYQRHKNRCFNCEHCYFDRSLEYMPEYQCKANNYHHIYLGVTGGVDRPVWCPVYGAEHEGEEMETVE